MYLKTLRARPEFGSVFEARARVRYGCACRGEKIFAAQCGGCHERGSLPVGEAPLITRARDGHGGSTAVTDDADLFRMIAYIKSRP